METRTITLPWIFPGLGEATCFDLVSFNTFAIRVPDTKQVLLIDYNLKEVYSLIIPKFTYNSAKWISNAITDYKSTIIDKTLFEYLASCEQTKKSFDLSIKFGSLRSELILTIIPITN